MGKTRQIHDAAYKAFFTDPRMVKSLLKGFLPSAIISQMDLESLSPWRSEFVGEKQQERRSDLVWRVKYRGNYCYLLLLIEFQSSQDWWMAVRIAAYVALLYQDIIKSEKLGRGDKLPPVLPIVLYNGKEPWIAPVSLRDLLPELSSDLGRYQPDISYYILDERRVDEDALLDEHNAASLIMRFERAKDIAQILPALKDLAALAEREEWHLLHKLFINWLGHSVFNKTEIAHKIINCSTIREAYNMLADIAPDWEAYFIEKGMEKGRIEGMEKGRMEGMEKGRIEGMEKGRIEVMRQCLKDILKLRFNVDGKVDREVDGISDVKRLEYLYELAFVCPAPEDFIAALETRS